MTSSNEDSASRHRSGQLGLVRQRREATRNDPLVAAGLGVPDAGVKDPAAASRERRSCNTRRARCAHCSTPGRRSPA
jgi:hypothetical protein